MTSFFIHVNFICMAYIFIVLFLSRHLLVFFPSFPFHLLCLTYLLHPFTTFFSMQMHPLPSPKKLSSISWIDDEESICGCLPYISPHSSRYFHISFDRYWRELSCSSSLQTRNIFLSLVYERYLTIGLSKPFRQCRNPQ